MKKEVVIIGYSGHSYVVIDVFKSMGFEVIGYCDIEEKKNNPYGLKYFGSEKAISTIKKISKYNCFVAVGDNKLRKKILLYLKQQKLKIVNAIHQSAIVSDTAILGCGIMIGPMAVVNSFSVIGEGAICNTSSVIEHECDIGSYSHIAPAAVLCGNIKVGENSFIGANAVVRQSILIGKNVTVGAGSVIVKNVNDNKLIVGIH